MIREYTPEDEKRVMEIWLAGNRDAHGFMDEEYLTETGDMMRTVYLSIADTYVYEQDGVVKGFASVIDNDFLNAVFVDEPYRRRRIGTELVRCCKEKYKSLDVSVYSENEPAKALCDKCGFGRKYETEDEETGHKVTMFGWIKMLDN